MTNKKPVAGFKKGKSGNPLGGKLHNPEMKLLKNLTRQEMAKVGSFIVKSTYDDLIAAEQNPQTPAIARMIISVAIKIIDNGDMHSFDILLNRLIGRVKEEDELTILFKRYEKLSDEELAKIALGQLPEESDE